MFNLKLVIAKVLSRLTMRVAVDSVDKKCFHFYYQPNIPESLKLKD